MGTLPIASNNVVEMFVIFYYWTRQVRENHMSEFARGYEAREPVTRRIHEMPWIAGLETAKHAANRRLVIEEALDAFAQTATGYHVDIVTHETHGHPANYLYSHLNAIDSDLEVTDCGRCSCGGYVTRVEKNR